MKKVQLLNFLSLYLVLMGFLASCSHQTLGIYSPIAPVLITPLPLPNTNTPSFITTPTPTLLLTPLPFTFTPTSTPTGTLTMTSIPTLVCISWTAQSSMPDKRQDFGVGSSNGILYAGGGYGPQKGGASDMALGYLESYNPLTNAWTELSSMLTPLENPACVVFNNTLYFFGGDDGTNISGYVQGYTISSSSWGYGNDEGFTPRTRASAVLLNNLIYVIGGYNTAVVGNQGGYLGVVESYNPATGIWSNLISALGVNAANMGVAALNGILYAFGGVTPSGPSSVMAAYNADSNSWSYKNNLPFSGGADGVVLNGILYAFSDVTDAVVTNFPTIYAYHPATDTWSSLCPLPVKRAGFAATALNNYIYTLGGANSLGDPGLNEQGGF